MSNAWKGGEPDDLASYVIRCAVPSGARPVYGTALWDAGLWHFMWDGNTPDTSGTDWPDGVEWRTATSCARAAEHNTLTEIGLHFYQQWARGMTGASERVADADLCTAIGEMVRAPCEPWRERVARLADTHATAGFDDAWLWRRALSHALESPALIARALMGEHLGIDPRGKTIDQMLAMAEKS